MIIHTKCGEPFENIPIFNGLESVLYCIKCGESYNGRNGKFINNIPIIKPNGKRKYYHYISK